MDLLRGADRFILHHRGGRLRLLLAQKPFDEMQCCVDSGADASGQDDLAIVDDPCVGENFGATVQRLQLVNCCPMSCRAGDRHVSDRDFVIAAYQASQIIGSTRDGQSYSMMLGGEQVRKIDDPFLRTSLMRLMSFNYEPVSLTSLQTRYRDHVREIIPDTIQEIIRAQCGDSRTAEGMISLPSTCSAPLPREDVAKGAALLRAHPELAEELQLHLSRVATFLFNLSNMDGWVRDSAAGIDQRKH